MRLGRARDPWGRFDFSRPLEPKMAPESDRKAALQGYLIGLGDLGGGSRGILVRVLIGISGLSLALPAGGLFGFSQTFLVVVTLIFLGAGIGIRQVFSLNSKSGSKLKVPPD